MHFLEEKVCFEAVVVLENEWEVPDALSERVCVSRRRSRNRMRESRVDEVRDDRVNVRGGSSVESESSCVRGCCGAAFGVVRAELNIVVGS